MSWYSGPGQKPAVNATICRGGVGMERGVLRRPAYARSGGAYLYVSVARSARQQPAPGTLRHVSSRNAAPGVPVASTPFPIVHAGCAYPQAETSAKPTSLSIHSCTTQTSPTPSLSNSGFRAHRRCASSRHSTA